MKYTVQNFWGTGLVAGLTVTPSVAVTSWTVDFDVADQQMVTNTYSASFVQTGSHVTLTNAVFDGSVAAGATPLTVGVMIYTNPTLTNLPASGFSLNGQPCSYTVYNPTGFTATPSSLTFTPTNWNTAQIVTVTSPEDADTTNQTATLPIQRGAPESTVDAGRAAARGNSVGGRRVRVYRDGHVRDPVRQAQPRRYRPARAGDRVPSGGRARAPSRSLTLSQHQQNQRGRV